MRKNNMILFSAYIEIEETLYNWEKHQEKPWSPLSPVHLLYKAHSWDFLRQEFENMIKSCSDPLRKAIFEEFATSRRVRLAIDKQRKDNMDKVEKERKLDEEAEAQGDMFVCQCCFTKCLNRTMISCDNEEAHVSTLYVYTGWLLG